MNYFERRQKIDELFGNDFYQKYPLSSRVLNRYIRSKIHYGNIETEIIKSEYRSDGGFRGLVKFLAYLFLYLLNLTISMFDRSDKGKILVSPSIFDRFEVLGRELKDKYNICLPLTKKRVRYILRAKAKCLVEIDKIAYSGESQKLLPETASSVGKFIDDSSSFNRKILFNKLDSLEKILNVKIDKLSRLFINKKIKLYVSAFDQIYDDTFNLLACQRAGIKTKCIAHAFLTGNIKDEPKSNCLPVMADKLYVWSQEDYDSLEGYEEPGKIEIGGYPKFAKEYIEKMIKKYPEKKIITFFSGLAYDEEWIKQDIIIRRKLFNKLKEISEDRGYEIYVRYHGKDEKINRKNEEDLIKECHIKISRNSLIKDLLQSEISLGFDTSCLYEAKVLGRKSFCLFTHTKYDKMYFLKNIEYIDVDDLPKKLGEKIDNNPKYHLLINVGSVID